MEKIQFTDNAIEAGIAAANEAANDSSFTNHGGDFCYGITLKLGFVVFATGQSDINAAAEHAARLNLCIRRNADELVLGVNRAILLSSGVSHLSTRVESVIESIISEEADTPD